MLCVNLILYSLLGFCSHLNVKVCVEDMMHVLGGIKLLEKAVEVVEPVGDEHLPGEYPPPVILQLFQTVSCQQSAVTICSYTLSWRALLPYLVRSWLVCNPAYHCSCGFAWASLFFDCVLCFTGKP